MRFKNTHDWKKVFVFAWFCKYCLHEIRFERMMVCRPDNQFSADYMCMVCWEDYQRGEGPDEST